MHWALAVRNPQRSRNAGITIHQPMKLQYARKKTPIFLLAIVEIGFSGPLKNQ